MIDLQLKTDIQIDKRISNSDKALDFNSVFDLVGQKQKVYEATR